MTETVLVDADARALALEPAQSFIVQAPAGSGKTTLLTQRFLRLLAATEEPEAIVAITFSRKAAEEMRARIVGALARVAKSEHGLDAVTAKWAVAARENAERRHWDLDSNQRRLRILTIDALAQLIVRRHPLLAGGTGAQQVLEDVSGLYAEAARDTIEEIASGSEWSPAVSRIVTHVDNNWARLEGLLSKMLGTRDQWLHPVVREPSRASIEHVLAAVVEQALAPLGKQIRQFARSAEFIEICRFAGANLVAANAQSAIIDLHDLASLPGAKPEDLPYWRGIADLMLTDGGTPRKRLTKNEGFPANDKQAKEHKSALTNFIADCDAQFLDALAAVKQLPDPQFDDAAWENLSALFTVLKLAAAHLGLVFQQTGMVDFTEVALSALRALGADEAPSDASLLLDHQIDHLLIDEFQDTSVIQYQLIERLIAGWSAEQSRSLFLVGDPKQSIYRFRQADVSRFTETFNAERFAQVPMKALNLRANFRSDPAVITWLNRAEENMAAADPVFPVSPPLTAVKPANATARVALHTLSSEDSSGECVVSVVRRALEEARHDVEQPSIAILVRNRSHLKDITQQLRDAQIPMLATDIEKLLLQPVVSDLWALARAMLHPADTTAWLAVLRAPWLGVGLSDLSHLAMRAEAGIVVPVLTAIDHIGPIQHTTRERLKVFAQAMQLALPQVGRRPIASLVAEVWHALGGSELAMMDGAYHYVERFLHLLDEYEAREAVVNASAFEQFLDSRYVSPQADRADAVQVMTIHKAKGLEFDVVILPGLNQKTRAEDKPLLRWQATENDELLMSLLPNVGQQDRLYLYLHALEKQAANAESYRLLYVALTRAKRQLHLLCEMDAEDSEPQKGSLQALLWPALRDEIVFEAGEVNVEQASETQALDKRSHLRRMRGLAMPQRLSDPGFEAPDPLAELEFSWASASAKYIGTVTHDILQLLGDMGWQAFNSLWQSAHEKMVSQRLTAIGIERENLVAAQQKVVQAIETALQSERARWLFDPAHREARSELPLSAVFNGETVNVILDRTFIDTDNTRWIVDFKTSEHLEADLEGFLDIQVERYTPQLNRYAEIYSLIDPRPTKLALYFPLHDAWREWDFNTTDTPR